MTTCYVSLEGEELNLDIAVATDREFRIARSCVATVLRGDRSIPFLGFGCVNSVFRLCLYKNAISYRSFRYMLFWDGEWSTEVILRFFHFKEG